MLNIKIVIKSKKQINFNQKYFNVDQSIRKKFDIKYNIDFFIQENLLINVNLKIM